METKFASNRMISILALYDLQTGYFIRALEGISNKDTHKRLDTKANHIAWLTGSLVQQRYDIANRLGIKRTQSADDLFKDNKGIQDDVQYPPLENFKKDWEKISPTLRDALASVTDKQLDEVIEMSPEFSMSSYELICFCTYREANCIGQIALWRRLLGYAAMNYM